MSEQIDELKVQEKITQTEWEAFDGTGDPHDWKDSTTTTEPQSSHQTSRQPHRGFEFPWFVLLIPLFFTATNGHFPFWGLFWLFIFMGPMMGGCNGRRRC